MPAPYANFAKTGFGGFATGVAPQEDPAWGMQQAQFAHQDTQQGNQNAWQGYQNAADRQHQQAQWDWQSGQNNLNRGLQQQQAAAQHDWTTQAQNSQQGFQGQQADLQRSFERDTQSAQNTFQGQQNTAERTNQMGIAQLPWNYKQGVFDKVSPLLMGLLGNGASPTGNQFGLVGGQNTPQPPITAGPIWTPAQIDQQVNSQRANNAASASGQQQQLQRQLAGQGFGSNSPLLTALSAGAQNQRMAADQQADLDTRFNAASGNAKQLLAGQQAEESQWADWNQADIQRRQAANQAAGITNNYNSSLIAALAGMIS